MLCLTGRETAVAELVARQRRCPSIDLHEIRLDFLTNIPDDLAGLVVNPRRTIIACRPERAGGQFRGDETARLALLARAAALECHAVDVEHDVESAAAARITRVAREHSTLLLRSAHVTAWSDAPAAWSWLQDSDGDCLKIAAPTAGAEQLLDLLDLSDSKARPVVKIGLGPGGIASRVCYRQFGSPWTYLGESPTAATAEGQPTLHEAARYGLDAATELRPVFLVGGSHVVESPGPVAHNRLFRQRGQPWSYVPLPADDYMSALTLMRRLRFVGASVTMPHKRRAAVVADRLESAVAHWRVVNTLYQTPAGELVGANTDGDAIVEVLGGAEAVAGKRAVVVGAGGAATAAGSQLAGCGARVTICARNGWAARQAAKLANGRWAGFWDFLKLEFDFLINAVPADALAALIRETPRSWPGRIVVDLAIRSTTSPMAAFARASGATYVRGLDVWCAQAARQQVLWTGLPTTADDVRAALHEEGWDADG